MFHIGTCPQCSKHDLALTVVAITAGAVNHRVNLYLKCPNCKLPSCALASNPRNTPHHELLNYNDNTQNLALTINEMWPSPPQPNVPEAIPSNVEKALLQAEANFVQQHNEAAAVMYRRSLELALKAISPELKGTLASRIAQLGKIGKLTEDLVSWANEIRDLGNDGAHEEEPMERPELESLRGFTEMILKYLFTLPNMVAEKRRRENETAAA